MHQWATANLGTGNDHPQMTCSDTCARNKAAVEDIIQFFATRMCTANYPACVRPWRESSLQGQCSACSLVRIGTLVHRTCSRPAFPKSLLAISFLSCTPPTALQLAPLPHFSTALAAHRVSRSTSTLFSAPNTIDTYPIQGSRLPYTSVPCLQQISPHDSALYHQASPSKRPLHPV